MLYACYDLIPLDLVMEISWRYGLNDYTMVSLLYGFWETKQANFGSRSWLMRCVINRTRSPSLSRTMKNGKLRRSHSSRRTIIHQFLVHDWCLRLDLVVWAHNHILMGSQRKILVTEGSELFDKPLLLRTYVAYFFSNGISNIRLHLVLMLHFAQNHPFLWYFPVFCIDREKIDIFLLPNISSRSTCWCSFFFCFYVIIKIYVSLEFLFTFAFVIFFAFFRVYRKKNQLLIITLTCFEEMLAHPKY